MKKIIALVVAIVMMAAMVVPGFAAVKEDIVANETNLGGTTITYGTNQMYTVTIPDSFRLEAGVDKEQTVTVSDYMLAADKVLTITVDSEQATETAWFLKEIDAATGADDVEFTITKKGGSAIAPGGVVLTADTVENADEVVATLVFNTAGTSQVAEFQAVITFSAKVDKVTA